MKKILLLVLVICVVALAGCRSSSNSVTKRQMSLTQASAEWDKLFNAGDAAGLAQLYSEDAVSMPPNGASVTGRKMIQADFERLFVGTLAHHQTKVDKILEENGLAIESAHYRMTYKPRNGGVEAVETGRHVECRRKIDGRWQIVLEIWNLDGPPSK